MEGQPPRLSGGPGASGRSAFEPFVGQEPETFLPSGDSNPAGSWFRTEDGDIMQSSTHLFLVLLGSLLGVTACNAKANPAVTAVPEPAVDAPRDSSAGQHTAVLSWRCFWVVQALYL